MPDYSDTVQQILNTPSQTLWIVLAIIVAVVVGLGVWRGGGALADFAKSYIDQIKIKELSDRETQASQIKIQQGLLESLTKSVATAQDLATAIKRSNDDNKLFYDSNKVKLADIHTALKAHDDNTPSRIETGIKQGLEGTRAIIVDATQPLHAMLTNYGVVFDAMLKSLSGIESQTTASRDSISAVKDMIIETQKSIKAIVDYAPPPEIVKTQLVKLEPLPHDEMESKP